MPPPPFIFRIDEIEQHPNFPERVDTLGHWKPRTENGANLRTTGGVSGTWWYCDTERIYEISGGRPSGSQHHKTMSMFFCGGLGFLVLNGGTQIRVISRSIPNYTNDSPCYNQVPYWSIRNSMRALERQMLLSRDTTNDGLQ